jgi:hypothetical protein
MSILLEDGVELLAAVAMPLAVGLPEAGKTVR